MPRRFMTLPMLILLVLPLVMLASCGDDDDKGTTPVNGADLPELSQIDFTTDVDFGSDDPSAAAAEGLVQTQLTVAQGISSLGRIYTTPLNSADWTDASGNCWTWTYSHAACTWTYAICEITDGYEWTLTLNGDCGDGLYDNWVAIRGTTNADGTSGSFRVYADGSTEVAGAWTWTTAADGKSGSCTFYEGDIDPQNICATLEWAENDDGSEDITWIVPEELKWVTHVNASGNAGSMHIYDWDDDADEWWLTCKIIWNSDGTGLMTYYDEDGNITTGETWS